MYLYSKVLILKEHTNIYGWWYIVHVIRMDFNSNLIMYLNYECMIVSHGLFSFVTYLLKIFVGNEMFILLVKILKLFNNCLTSLKSYNYTNISCNFYDVIIMISWIVFVLYIKKNVFAINDCLWFIYIFSKRKYNIDLHMIRYRPIHDTIPTFIW